MRQWNIILSNYLSETTMKRSIDGISGGSANPGSKRSAGEENADGDVSKKPLFTIRFVNAP